LGYSGHSIIGCYFDGFGAAIHLAEGFNEEGYHLLEEWYQITSTGFSRVIDKCDELFCQEIAKPNRKVEIFINPLITLEKGLTKYLKVYPSPVRIASIDREEAFTVLSSLLAERKISLAPQISGLEKELRSFDPLAIERNHRIYALFNAVAQPEFNRLTCVTPYYARVEFTVKTVRSYYPSVFDGDF
jgi:hypothetical protein